ncbi:hypothetical protein ACMFMF_011780 [Clarireedia jacksonii]
MAAKYRSLEANEAACDAGESEEKEVQWLLFARTSWYMICGLLLGLLFGLFLGINLRFISGGNSNNLNSFNDESPLPKFSRVPTVWQPNEAYMGAGSRETNAHWQALMPEPAILWVEHPDHWKLGPGVGPDDDKDANTNFYMVSVIHQFHCVKMIRKAYWILRDGLWEGQDDVESEHVEHCFEYLRQAVLCSGDLTIEPSNPIPGITPISGWNVTHQCLDYASLREYISEQDSWYHSSVEGGRL